VIFRSLGRVGDTATVERLAAMIEKKGLRLLTGNRDQKILAIRALECILDDSALVLLDRLSDDSNQLVQSRARRARTTLSTALLDGEAPMVNPIDSILDNEADGES
jgi:HEAT repeat protein